MLEGGEQGADEAPAGHGLLALRPPGGAAQLVLVAPAGLVKLRCFCRKLYLRILVDTFDRRKYLPGHFYFS